MSEVPAELELNIFEALPEAWQRGHRQSGSRLVLPSTRVTDPGRAGRPEWLRHLLANVRACAECSGRSSVHATVGATVSRGCLLRESVLVVLVQSG